MKKLAMTMTVAATLSLTGAAAEEHFDALATEIEMIQESGYGIGCDDIDIVTAEPILAGGFFGDFQGTDLDGRW